MNKIILALTATIFIICVAILVFVIGIKKVISPQEELENLKSELFAKEMIAIQNIGEAVLNSDIAINIDEKFVDKIPVSDKPIFVCRYSAFGCNLCVDFALEKVKEIFPDCESSSKILFIASEYKQKTRTEFANCVNIADSDLGLSFERTKLPFFFILINSKTQHVFIPDKNEPKQTEIYLKEIKKRYF